MSILYPTTTTMPSRDLNQLHPALRKGVNELIKRGREQGLQILVTQTYRSIAYQNQLFAQGRTSPGNIVTNARGGQSPHNFRYAFDICQNIRGREWEIPFFEKCAVIWRAMGGEWGGDWKTFVDRPHFQYTHGRTDSQVRAAGGLPDNAKMPWEEDIAVVDKTTMLINGVKTDVNRILKDGTNYVGLRELATILGFDVEWDEKQALPKITMKK